jgi:carbonic anhydrase
MSYQSPIVLHHCCSIDIEKPISIKGENIGSQFDTEKHIFKVQNTILLRANGRKYRLEEYHFHVPCEHIVDNTIYPAEIHYVFHEMGQNLLQDVLEYRTETSKPSASVSACPCCEEHDDRNILVVGRCITSVRSGDAVDISRFPVQIPSSYYEYDGSLTTGNFTPVRWIVGDDPLRIDIEQLLPIAKPARPVQDGQGRILLYSTATP